MTPSFARSGARSSTAAGRSPSNRRRRAAGPGGRRRPGEAAALDAADLIGLDAAAVRLAYPFTADPNDFEVVLPGGRSRHACCAIDALGVAPMLGARVTVKSRCHWSGVTLVFDVDPLAGPCRAPPGSLAWVEQGQWGGDRLSGFL